MLQNMWFFPVEDFNRNSRMQQPSPISHSVQGGPNPPATIDYELSGYGTNFSMAGLRGGSTGAEIEATDGMLL